MADPQFPTAGDAALMTETLMKGGPALWAIAALSVVTVAVILWKVWRLSATGVWRRGRANRALAEWRGGRWTDALATAQAGRGVRAAFAREAITLAVSRTLPIEEAKAEAEQLALDSLAGCRTGLRALDIISTVAPLLGLLGTVLGMIEAFQTLETAGARADAAALAGGIWEALLTTAAGMAVAIPALLALGWFEGVVEGLARDLERIGTGIFAHAAEARRMER